MYVNITGSQRGLTFPLWAFNTTTVTVENPEKVEHGNEKTCKKTLTKIAFVLKSATYMLSIVINNYYKKIIKKLN